MECIDRSVLPIDQEQLLTRPGSRTDINLMPVKPPDGAPNVVIVLIDDMGFGATSAFGGPCQTPTAERLASGGLKYTRFHTTALCSPTRQALLTGRNHHAVNMGNIIELATPVRGYSSVRPASAAPLAQILRLNGYNTAAFGKWHQTPAWETSASGPFDRWPTGEGFERFYGFVCAEMDHWSPLVYDGTTPVDVPDDPNYHFSEDIVTRSIDWVQQQRVMAPDRPFFLYVPFGATHAPHHVPKPWIEKYHGRFDSGWDAEREQILASQRRLGVVPADCELTGRHKEIPAWTELTVDERKVAARLMETYAGFVEHTDAQVGRLVDSLADSGALDNTLFLYILGDNGASGEGGLRGTLDEHAELNGVFSTPEEDVARLEEIGGPDTFGNYPVGWAHAMDTPYQWTKQVASHWGGTRVGMVVHWPDGMKAHGEVRNQWHHVIDVVPTILEAARLPIPKVVNGTVQQRTDGVSMLYSFADGTAPDRRHTQYFEMFGNRGIYHDGWAAATRHSIPWQMLSDDDLPALKDDVWELYAPGDWSEAHDVAAEYPEKLRELQELFLQEAERNNVLPINDKRRGRADPTVTGRPSILRGRREVTLTPGMRYLRDGALPDLLNRSHVIESSLVIDEAACGRGVIVSQGGHFGGWTFYLSEGRLAYAYNWFGRVRYDALCSTPLSAGQHLVRLQFTVDGVQGFGKPGTVTLYVDGCACAESRIERTIPYYIGIGSWANVGCDLGTPVIDSYDTPRGSLAGAILHWVRISVDDADREIAPDQVTGRISMAAQ